MKIIVVLLWWMLPLCQLQAFKTANLVITLFEKIGGGKFEQKNRLDLQGKFSPLGPAQGAEGSVYEVNMFTHNTGYVHTPAG